MDILNIIFFGELGLFAASVIMMFACAFFD